MFEDLEYINNGSVLSIDELKNFTSFCLALSQNGIKTRMIFRGENYLSLKEKLLLNDNNDFNKLNALIFLIGEKGRGYRKDYKKKIINKKKIYPIDSVENNIFKYIFNKINLILTKKKNKQEVKQFIRNNICFDKYFSNKNNLSDFLTKIPSIIDKQTKIKIRDYYLNLLHQIGQIGFYNNSFFVSTTTDIKVAEEFASNSNESERIIFISWITYPMNQSGLTLNYLNKLNESILNLDLPTYSKSFFPKQKEVLIKGGLLPHYILGYIRVEKKELIVNPNLFTTKRGFNKIIKNGFEIDQSNFKNAINESDYSGYFILDENDTYTDSNK